MHFFKGLLIFFINSNLLISFCAVAFFLTGASFLGLDDYEQERLLVIFSATFLTYNLTIFLSAFTRENNKAVGKMAWFLRNKKVIYALLGINLGLLLYFFPYSSFRECLFFFHFGIISLLYNIPEQLANTRYRSIRSVPLIKIFLISYVWAAIGAYYPAILKADPAGSLLLFFLFFLFILSITLPFDIRDYHSDQKSELLTIPGLIGIRATKIIAIVLMLVYGAGIGMAFTSWIAAGILTGLTIILIKFSSGTRPDWYYTGLVDSLIILQYFLVWLFDTGTNLA